MSSRAHSVTSALAAALSLLILSSSARADQAPQVFPQDALRADLRQLVALLEASHPDPYERGGGRVAFHRRAAAASQAIPAEGMTAAAFLRLLRPLAAALADGHTTVRAKGERAGRSPRAWIDFDIVEDRVYVAGVYRPEDQALLGALLDSVEGVPFPELLERMARLQGPDNRYTNLVHLVEALRTRSVLTELLERDEQPIQLRFGLRPATAPPLELTLPLRDEAPGPRLAPPSPLSLPPANAAGLSWGFLGETRHTAYLRIATCMRYREAFEVWRATGFRSNLGEHLTKVAEAAKGGPVPEGIDERLALVPSATETFSALLDAMRSAKTQSLIVDLRENRGGNSAIELILSYFLYGPESLVEPEPGYQIPRYSALYFEKYEGASLDKVAPGRGLKVGDYDFSAEEAWRARRDKGDSADDRRRREQQLARALKMVPSFARSWETRSPKPGFGGRVLVLTSAWTYSAGFDIAAMLHRHGATLVGVPSSQAGNCTIDSLPYRLDHTRLGGTISYKYSLRFPEDPKRGRLLVPELELSYDALSRLGFSPDAAVSLGLERGRAE